MQCYSFKLSIAADASHLILSSTLQLNPSHVHLITSHRDHAEVNTNLCASILPALAFSLDMFTKTHNSYGVNEVLLSSVMACVIFSLFSAQPLVIVGVTGPITVFSYTVYDIVVPQYNFFSFMAWIGIWSLIMHWILAITNSCNALTYVTRFSCDTFGFYVAFIYLQKGIQVLTRQWGLAGPASAYLQIMVALLVLGVAWLCGIIGESKLFHRYVRKFIEDYGTPLTIIFFTGFVHIGHMANVETEKLPTSKSFFPTADRGWFVSELANATAGEVFLALPFALLLTILFWFDHNGIPSPLSSPHPIHVMLTTSSLLPHRPRHRIPSTQTPWFSLGHLPPRADNWYRRPSRHPLPKRPDPTSPFPH